MKVNSEYRKLVNWIATAAKLEQDLCDTKRDDTDSEGRNWLALIQVSAEALHFNLRRYYELVTREDRGEGTSVQGPLFPEAPTDRDIVRKDIRAHVESFFDKAWEVNDAQRPPKGDVGASELRGLFGEIDDSRAWPT